jgi:hypothetical protein
MAACLLMVGLQPAGIAEGIEGTGLATAVAVCTEQGERRLLAFGRLLVKAAVPVHAREVG